MDLLARLRGARGRHDAVATDHDVPASPIGEACPRCGERNDRIVDPAGGWFVCTRCGARTEHEVEA